MSPETNQSIAAQAEPKAGRHAVPLWLIIGCFLLIFWGMVYFDQSGAWFDPQVYGPYHSVQEVADMWPKDDTAALFLKGKDLFSRNCAVCHMESGIGNPANGCPPLVDSEWVKAPGPGRIVRIVSKGLTGPIDVKGQTYATGTMLAIGDQMPVSEKEKAENIAAIISYVRKTFGNIPVPIKPEQVASIREKIANHPNNFTAADLKSVPETE